MRSKVEKITILKKYNWGEYYNYLLGKKNFKVAKKMCFMINFNCSGDWGNILLSI